MWYSLSAILLYADNLNVIKVRANWNISPIVSTLLTIPYLQYTYVERNQDKSIILYSKATHYH